MVGRVVVIGAGIAGLVTAKVLRDDGFEVLVVEKGPAIGGVWTPSRTYPGLRTNNSRETYAYSDHPYDRSADFYPSAEQVRGYLDSYISRFELAGLFRLSTEVVRIGRSGAGFEVQVRDPDGPADIACDFVVVCTGTYSAPAMPNIEGAERFTGTIVHSSEAADPAVLEGKRVIVVGAGKSALDCAVSAAEHGKRSTLVFRAPHWMVPRYLFGVIPVDRLVLGRVPEMLIPYHRRNRWERFLHGRGALLTWSAWRLADLLFRAFLRMPAAMSPEQSLPHGLENIGLVSEFYTLARRGRIALRRDTITSFDAAGVSLASGRRLPADTIVFATGWRQELPFLTPELRHAIQPDGRFSLYRHILPPTEQRLGFIGYANSTACPLTAEISAHWLAQAFRGELNLPEVDAMNTEIRHVHEWLAEVYPARPQGYFLGQHLIHHLDDLLADMGLPTRRTRNVIIEYFGKFGPPRYRDVAAQRRAAKHGD
ncbi:flavin-containing monooxygenase [Nocardia sp. NPDC051570]|uniref:flavin-containing monooxygenase n=1 Tax=Nocardia sp. NPDC051570 TaxID=3364324 RepID=UPI003792C422